MGELTPEEVKILIKASKIAREKGITKGASVKEICDKAGISRKTGYQWVNEEDASQKAHDGAIGELNAFKRDHEKLLRKYKDLQVLNEGLNVRMEIHGFNDLLKKKGILPKGKKRKR